MFFLLKSQITLSQCTTFGQEGTLTSAITATTCTNQQVVGIGLGPGSRKIYSGFTAGQIVELFMNNASAGINCVQGRWCNSSGTAVGSWFTISNANSAPTTYTEQTVPATADRLEVTTGKASWIATSALLNYRQRNPSSVSVTGGEICASGGTITASGGTNGTIYWQGTTTNGTSTSSGSGTTSPSYTTAGTYYARARDNTTSCWGVQGSGAVTLKEAVNSVSASASTTTICFGSTTTLTGTAAAGSSPKTASGSGGTSDGSTYGSGVNISITFPALPSGAVVTSTTTTITYTSFGASWTSELRIQATPPAAVGVVQTDLQPPGTSNAAGTLTNTGFGSWGIGNPAGTWLFQFRETADDGLSPDASISNITITCNYTLTPTYSWTSSPSSFTSSLLSPGAITPVAAGTYTYTLTATANGCSLSANTAAVTIRGAFTGGTLASSAQTICNNASPANITYTTAPSGGSSLQYQWYRQTGSIAAPSGAFSIGSWTTVGTQSASSTLSGATIGNLTATTSFACRVIDVGSPACFDNWAGNVHVVTVNPAFSTGTIQNTGEIICYNGNPSLIGSSVAASGGNGSITYEWRANGTPIASTNTATYDPPAGLITTTTYTRWAKDGLCNTTFTQSTNSWIVTVRSQFTPGAITASTPTICYAGDPPNILNTTLSSGGDGSITYEWRANGTPIGSSNSSTYDPPSGLTATTTYTRWAKDATCNTSFTQSTNSSVVTVRPQFTPGAILTTGQTICNGGTPTVIGNSVVSSGGDATITYSWRSSADSYGAAIGGAIASTYTPPAGLTTTTSYRRYANDGTCNISPEVSTGTWTVTVQSVPTAGTIGTAQTICNATTPSGLTSSSAGSGDGTISYQWQSAVSPFSSYGNIGGQVSDAYSPGSLSATTRYQRYTVSTLNGIACNSSPTSAIEITVQSAVTAGSIASTETICYNTTPASITSVDGTGSGTITYRWDVSTTSAVAGFSDLGNSASTFSPGALTQDTWYRRYTISTQNAVGCESAATAVILKKVQTVPTAGTIGADRTICNNTTTTILGGTPGGGRSGSTISYRWEVSTTSDIAGFSSAGVTTASITTPSLTVDTWYRRITISTLDGTPCESSPTSATKVTVQTVPTAGIIEADQTICNGTAPATISNNTVGSGLGTITYRWEKSTTNAGSGYSAQGGALSSLSPGSLTATTWYRRYTISTLNSNACESSATAAVQITVQSVPTAGAIEADQTICYNTTPATISNQTVGTGDGTITYRWQSSTTSAVAGFSDNGTVTASFSPSALTQDTWYKRYTVSTLNGVACESVATTVIKVTVQTTPGAGSIGSDQTICYNTAPSGLTSSSIGTGTGTISYVWEVSTTNASSGFSIIGGASTSTYAPSALTASSWYRRSTTSTLNGNACTSTTTSAVQITVRPNFTPGSILTTGETICSNNNPIQIDNNVVSSGGDNSITYEWRANGTPIGSTNASSYDPPATSITTTFTRWAKDATCNTTFEQSTGSWLVTVNNPTVTTSLSNNDFVWTGLNSTDWATTTNWLQWNSSSSSYSVPGSYPNANTANVILPAVSGCVLNNSVTNGNSLAVNNLTIEASHTFGLNNSSASLSVAGTLTVNGTWSTPTSGSTVIFNGAGAQTIPVLAYSNLSTATGGTKTLAGNLTVSRVLTIGASSTLNLSTFTLTLPFVGTPLVNSGTFTASTGKVDFNGAGNQSLAGLSYYNLTTSGSGTKSLLGNTSVGNTLALDAGTLTVGANILTINGSSVTRTSGSIDASNSSATLAFNNSSDLTLPSSIFSADVNNLTLSNAKVKASSDFTVNGTLYLNHANPNSTDGLLDLVQDYGSYADVHSADNTNSYNNLNSVVLTLGSNATTDGVGDVTGKIKRTSFTDGLTYTFGNKNMRIKLDQHGGTLPSSIVVVATKGNEGLHVDKDGTSDFTPGTSDTLIGGAAVKRMHQILRTGGTSVVKFTVRFPYDDSELNGNAEANLVTWDHHIPYGGMTPHEHGKTSIDNTENYVELANHGLFYLAQENDAAFTKYWMLSKKVTIDTLWLGASSGASASDWTNSINWTSGAVPSNWTKVVVDANIYKSELEIIGNRQAATIEIKPGAILNGGTGSLTLNGGPIINGGAGTWVNNGTFNPGTSEIIINNSDATISGNTNFYDLTINTGKTAVIQANSIDTISGTLTLNGTLDATANENTIVYNGDSQSIFQLNGTTPGYYHLTISQTNGDAYAAEPLNTMGDLLIANGNLEMDGNALEVKGDLINNTSLNGAFLVTMSGTSDQLIGGTSPFNFFDLILTGSDTVTVQNDVVVNNTLTVDASKTLAGGSSNFEFYNTGAPFILNGNFVPQTSTIKYLASDLTDITATTYHNLYLAGGTTKSVVGNTVVNNELNIDTDALDMQTYSLSIGGTPSIANGSTVDADNGEIIFANDNSTINLPSGFFAGDVKDMTLSGNQNVELNNNLTITGTLDVAEGDLLLGANLLVMESNSTWTRTNGFLNTQTGSVLFKSAGFDPSVLPSETLNNLELSRAGVIEVTGNLEVAGEFKLSEGTIDVNNHTLKLSGDMIYVDGEIDADAGKVDFNNGAVWNLPSTFFVGDVKKLQVSGAGGIGLARDHKITDSLIMTGGNIDLSGNNLEIGSSASQPGVISWNTGTVVGPLKRWFAAATNSSIESGIFPVGTSILNRYAQVNFTQAPDGGYLVIDFKNGMPPGANYDTDLPIPYTNEQGLTRYIQNADQSGYWEMTPYNAAGEAYEALDNFNYNLALRINNPTSVQNGGVLNNPPGVKLIRAKGFADGSHGDWELAGTYSTFVELNAGEDYVIKSVNVQGFSWFNGGGDNANPLPVELISFNGLCEDNKTTLSWQTASEFHSAYFEVQKSTDGENWRVINTQNAAGNSTELLSYQAIDNSSTEQNGYYRLVQVDENGEENVYDPIFIGCNETTSSIKTYPNPSDNSFQVVINDKNLIGKATFEMVDTKGTIINSREVVISEGVNMILINQNVDAGVYYIKITNGVNSSKVVKHVVR